MQAMCEVLTATVEDALGSEHRIKLVRQADGCYREMEEAPDALTARLEGRFGEEHRIRLVRQANGCYEEVLEPADCGQL